MCFNMTEKPVTLLRGIQLDHGIDSLISPVSSVISTIGYDNLENIRGYIGFKNTLMIIRVHPGTFLMDLAQATAAVAEQGEILIDKGGTMYIHDYIDASSNEHNLLKITYFPIQHCSTLYMDKISYDTLLNSHCSVLPSAMLEPIKTLTKDEFKNRYIMDIASCTGLNDLVTTPTEHFRVLTYNVHEWKDLSSANTQDQCMDAILRIDADVVCLQETTSEVPDLLKNHYRYHVYEASEQMGSQHLTLTVLSKHEILKTEVSYLHNLEIWSRETRILLRVDISYNDKNISIYNTHLSLEEKVAKQQIIEIAHIVNTNEKKGLKGKIPFVVCGDFNHVDIHNYTSYQIEFLENNRGTGANLYKTLRKACKIKPNNWNFNKHRYSVWTSRAVDFIFPSLRKFSYDFSAVYYTTASDHLPYYMDLRIK